MLNWFKQQIKNNNKNSDYINDILEKKYNKKVNQSICGGEWHEYSNNKRVSEMTKCRIVKLNTSSYMVGGGHFFNDIDVQNDEFIGINDDEISLCSPWDKIEHRPAHITRNYLDWYGISDSKRTTDLESGLQWLKDIYFEFKKRYKEELGITLLPIIGEGIKFELEQLEK